MNVSKETSSSDVAVIPGLTSSLLPWDHPDSYSLKKKKGKQHLQKPSAISLPTGRADSVAAAMVMERQSPEMRLKTIRGCVWAMEATFAPEVHLMSFMEVPLPDHCLALDPALPPEGWQALARHPKGGFTRVTAGDEARLLFHTVEQKSLLRLASSNSHWHEPRRLASFPDTMTSDPCPAPCEKGSLAPGLGTPASSPSHPTGGQQFLLSEMGLEAAGPGRER